MNIRWYKRAVKDLQLARQARAYVNSENPDAAKDMAKQILDSISLLAEHPGIGRTGRVPNTKEMVIEKHPFIVAYRVKDHQFGSITRTTHIKKVAG